MIMPPGEIRGQAEGPLLARVEGAEQGRLHGRAELGPEDFREPLPDLARG